MQFSKLLLREEGHAPFFVLILLPTLTLLGAFAIDLTSYRTREQQLQREVDFLALESAPLLRTPATLERFLEEYTPSTTGARLERSLINFERGEVTLTLRTTIKPHFLAPLNALQHKALSFSLEATAAASIPVSDTVFIVANGSTLRPAVARLPSTGAMMLLPPWRPQEWPAARYFDRCPGTDPIQFGSEQYAAHSAEWLTQACFNPAFTPLKQSAIALYDALATQPNSRVALLFTPGGNQAVEIATLLYPTDGTSGAARFEHPSYRESFSGVSDALCLALATYPAYPYALPASEAAPPPSSQCTTPLSPLGCRVQDALNPCFFTHSPRIREQIYWRAAQLDETREDLRIEPKVGKALELGLTQLSVTTPSHAHEGIEVPRLRRIVLFTDLLTEAPTTELATRLQQTQSALTVVVFLHSFLTPAENQQTLATAEQWKTIPGVTLLIATSPEELLREVLPQVIHGTTPAILRS